MSSEAEKARRMNGWTAMIVAMNTRLRVGGSCSRWFWLAMIIRGSSQQDRISRGEEIWSIAVQSVRLLFEK